ncbi:MAG: sigma-70 family RNA polymerase sigma factor [Planctomycetota bacterium]
MDEQNQAALVALAARGDQIALQRLIVHCDALLRRFLLSKLDPASRRHIDPDDVLQDVYVAAFKAARRARFSGPGAFYKWLERIAHNRLKNCQRAFRQAKRNVGREMTPRRSPSTSYPDLLARLSASDSTPSRHLAKAEAKVALMSCLARLTEDQRTAVTMRFLESRPVKEIAARLGKADTAVYMLLHRGLKALRESLGSLSRFLTHL